MLQIGANIRQVRFGVKAAVTRALRNLPWVPEDIEDEDEGEDEEEPPSLYFNHDGSPTAAAGKALSSGSWRKVEHEDGTVDDFGSPLVLNIIQGLAPGLWKKVPVAAPDAFAIYTSPAVAAFISAVVSVGWEQPPACCHTFECAGHRAASLRAGVCHFFRACLHHLSLWQTATSPCPAAACRCTCEHASMTQPHHNSLSMGMLQGVAGCMCSAALTGLCRWWTLL